QAVCVLNILETLGRIEEAVQYAERIAADPDAKAEELYQAAATFLRRARQMGPTKSARPVFQKIVSILERSLRVFLITDRDKREVPDGDRYIITMLGFCHEQLGNVDIAVQLYSDGLARYPGDDALLTFRGLVLIDTDLFKGLDDCRRAVRAGSLSM